MRESAELQSILPPVKAGHRSLWLSIRLVCQLLVILYYMNVPQYDWQRAVLSIGTCVIVGVNLTLFNWRDDVIWRRVQRICVMVECVLVALLSLCLLAWQPTGPATLILLPTLLTYTSLYDCDWWQWLLSLVPLAELIWMIRVDVVIVHVGNDSAPNPTSASNLSMWLLVVLYGVIIIIGTAFAYLLQVQNRERQQLLRTMVQVQHQAQQLSIVNNQVNEYTEKIYQLATSEERNRIAGEIHDTVAHRLTALLVQLQAARRIWTNDADAEAAQENLVVCEALAREALDEVRTSVRAIRRTSVDEGITSLRRLVLQFSQLTGMEAAFEIDVSIGILPAQVMAILYRVIQEALTNAQRHGRATRVDLCLKRKGAFVELDAKDNGKGTPHPVLGFGLSSMQQRLRQFGGELIVSSQPGLGFQLSVQLPIWEGAFE